MVTRPRPNQTLRGTTSKNKEKTLRRPSLAHTSTSHISIVPILVTRSQEMQQPAFPARTTLSCTETICRGLEAEVTSATTASNSSYSNNNSYNNNNSHNSSSMPAV